MRFVDVAANTLILYLYLIFLMRFFGRRQLGQLTPIDLLVVILLGSCVETAMIHGDTSLLAGLVSALTLLIANRLLTLAFSKSKRVRHWMIAGPTLVVHNGQMVEANLRRLGLTPEDVMEGLREREQDDISNVRFGVMESDGTINVVTKAKEDGPPD